MKRSLPALALVLTAASLCWNISPALAQNKMDHKMDKGSKMASKKTVYACKMCKTYYTPTMAKKMGYKDSMGHKLSKMMSVPAGYSDGSKMKMDKGDKMGKGDKMDKMGKGDKM